MIFLTHTHKKTPSFVQFWDQEVTKGFSIPTGTGVYEGGGCPGERPPEHLSTRWNPPSVPLRASPRSSAQLRAGSRQLGIERLLRASWAGEKWEGGGEREKGGGEEDGEGLLETKEFLKIRGEKRRGPREAAAGRGLCSFGLVLGFLVCFFFFPKLFLLCKGKPLRIPPRLSLSSFFFLNFLAKQQTNKQTPRAFEVKSEGQASAGPGLGNRTLKPC